MEGSIICIICVVLVSAAFGALLHSLPDTERKDERKTVIAFLALSLAVIVIDCIAAVNITMTESLERYDKGKIEKVVKYRSESVNGKIIKIDSTYTYRAMRK